MNNLNLLLKPTSSLCNIKCDYCFYFDIASHREQFSYGFMSIETAEQIIKKAFSSVTQHIHFGFQGGEPSLIGLEFYQQFHFLINQYNTNSITPTFSFQTNGTLLNDKFAILFKERNYLVGVSLDGIEETHNEFRKDHHGKATFQQVLEGIQTLKKHNVDFNILTVITKDIAQRASEIMAYYQEQNFRYIQFIPCIENINQVTQKYSLSSIDYQKFLIDTFAIYKENIIKDNYFSIRYFDNLVGFFAGYPYESCDMQGNCSVNMVIESDGSVYPCDFYVLDKFKLGNIHKDNYEDIQNSNIGKQFCAPSFLLAEKCKSCPFIKICRGGGCYRHRLDDRLTNRFCDAYYHFFMNHINDLQIIAYKLK